MGRMNVMGKRKKSGPIRMLSRHARLPFRHAPLQYI